MEKYVLKDLISVKRGMSLSGEYYSTEGDLIRLTLGNFQEEGGFKINTSKDDLYFTGPVKDEFLLAEGDIITPLTEQVVGLLGATARIPESGKYIQSGDVALIKCISDKIDDGYCYYLISSDVVRKQLSAAAQQTKIRHTSPEKIMDCEVFIPEVKEQRKIANLLDSINKKIELNNRINDNLQQQLRLIYNQWFIQCNPIASSNGISNSGTHWDNYLMRNIPNNWSLKPLSEIGTIVCGGTPSTAHSEYYTEKGIAWITPNDLSANTQNIFINHGSRDISQEGLNNSSAMLMPAGSILLSTRAPIGYIAISETEVCTNQGFKSVVPDKGIGSAYIYFTLLDMIPRILHLGAGTTFMEVSKDSISSLKVLCPPNNIINAFCCVVEPLLKKCSECQNEIKQLLSLRNYLLPLLMSGQATIAD